MRQGHGGGEKKHFDSVSSTATATASARGAPAHLHAVASPSPLLVLTLPLRPCVPQADWAQTLAAQPPAAAPETESAETKPEGGKTIVTEGQTMPPPAPSTKS